MNTSNKIKIAFVKYAGLTSGGSEKLLQIIAANLPKNIFEVTFFYSKPALNHKLPNGMLEVDPSRKKYLIDSGVILKEFKVSRINFLSPYYNWENTNFFSIFNEKDFDIIQTCRAGRKEYPFNLIKRIPIVDIIALSAGVDNQFNISRVVHLSRWSSFLWSKKGGDFSRVVHLSLPIEIPVIDKVSDLLHGRDIKNFFIYGFHQRVSEDIFSDIPLKAYKEMENNETMFMIMGGAEKYKKQASDLNIKNIIFIPFSGNSQDIFTFLKMLDVYCHGRKDGEINSQAIAEALSQGLPIVTHYSVFNNGQLEGVGLAGKFVWGYEEYSKEMLKLKEDKNYFNLKAGNARKQFQDFYELKKQIRGYIDLYMDVIKNPYPNKIKRFIYSLHYSQNIRILAIWFYYKISILVKFLKS